MGAKTILKATAAMTAAAMLMAPAASNATTWVTQLEYDATGKVASLGTVTITDGLNGGTDVQVRLDLNAGFVVDTGSHYAFTFNLDPDAGNVVTVNEPTGGSIDYIYANTWSQEVCPKNKPCYTETDPPPYANSPFGNFSNAFFLSATGGSNTVPTPFIFTVHNDAGITFAGTGVTPGPGGQLTTLGDGLHFESNTPDDGGSVPGYGPGGWWFAVDTSGADSNCSPTCVIAGRDAFTSVVPEPATWALMILGFGGAGAMLRTRRRRMLTI